MLSAILFLISYTQCFKNSVSVLTCALDFLGTTGSSRWGSDDVDASPCGSSISFRALWYLYFSYCGLNVGIASTDFLTHYSVWFPWVSISTHVQSPPRVTIVIFGLSLWFSTDIICTFWLWCKLWFGLPLACYFATSWGQSSVVWSSDLQYVHVLHWFWKSQAKCPGWLQL